MSSIIQPEDAKYYVRKPDSSFSPQRNMAIIQEVIRDAEKLHNTDVVDELMRERFDMVATYGKYRLSDGGQKDFGSYMGKKLYTQIVGEKIAMKGKIRSTVFTQK